MCWPQQNQINKGKGTNVMCVLTFCFFKFSRVWFYSNLNLCHSQEAFVQRCSLKKVFLEVSQNSQENTCARSATLLKRDPEACNFIKKETLAQLFSCEFCEISKNTYTEHIRTPASVLCPELQLQNTIEK